MIGTITYILARAGWRAMNGTIADERRRLAGAEPPAAYVSYDPRLLAGVGWYGYRIAFKGGDRQMIERARHMLSERYTIRDSYEYYADGVYVIGVLLRQRVPHYGIGGAPAPEPDALNFYMPNGGTVSLNKTGSPTVVELEYSLDGGATWTVWAEDGSGNRSMTLTAGQRMYVRNISETQTGFSTSSSDYYQFAFTDTVEVHGNINSLMCKNAESVTTLTDSCYRSMFKNCSSLVTAPKLHATTLADSCCRSMFQNCSSLVTAPELHATTLAANCYQQMFLGCSSLVTAPELPATVLADNCYRGMFQDCQSLVNAPELPATVLADSCYRGMFQDCQSLVNAPELPATVLADSCYRLMFKNCSSLVNAPDLPATTLAANCYYLMFNNCSSLVTAPKIHATTLADSCCSSMFQGCSSLVTAPELHATTLAANCYQQMFLGCPSISLVKTYMTDISASYCLTDWLSGVAAAGDFYCDQNLTIPTGASGIPSGWTRHDI